MTNDRSVYILPCQFKCIVLYDVNFLISYLKFNYIFVKTYRENFNYLCVSEEMNLINNKTDYLIFPCRPTKLKCFYYINNQKNTVLNGYIITWMLKLAAG